MKKWISYLVLLAMLGIVPLGSWYYLKQGLDYRKQALKELLPKQTIEWSLDSISPFQGKTTLWVLDSAQAQIALPPIVDQFNDAYTFQLAGSWRQDGVTYIPPMVKDSLNGKAESVFALVDTSGQIRNYYTAETKQLKSMVEHLAVLLPNAKDKDIKMK